MDLDHDRHGPGARVRDMGQHHGRLVHVDRSTLLPVSVPGMSHFRPNPPWFSTSSTRDNDSEHKSLRAATSHLFGIHFCAQTAAT